MYLLRNLFRGGRGHEIWMDARAERRGGMAQIELTPSETEMLKEILQKHLSELTFEIAFCHNRDSVAFLMKRKEFIESLMKRL